MIVPFADLKTQYHNHKDAIDNAIKEVIENTAFIGGKFVSTFENEFATKIGLKQCVSCANGTDALFLAMKMLGIGGGDEVITTAISWIATPEMISLTGAKPVFVDVEKDFFTIDTDKIEAAITTKTKAILPVHLYGQMSDMGKIMKIARKHKLFVIEDCAQSHFSEYEDKFAGTFGDAGTFSFFPGKNLGAYGDAGAVVTNNKELAEKMFLYKNHGQEKKNSHLIEGISSRLDGIHASILSAKLPHIDNWNRKRQEIAKIYSNELNGVGDINIPLIRKDTNHTFHIYAIRTTRRDELQQYLKNNGISTGIHYPTSLPNMLPYIKENTPNNEFIMANTHTKNVISLPLFPEMTNEMVAYVIEKIKTFYDANK
jgi:dTDP-4-amino-4,6-dideoxygalactose transaminase